MESVEITLASGKSLRITSGSFEESQALYEAILEEAKTVQIDGRDEIFNLIKNSYCTAFASKKVKILLQPLLARAIYDGKRITKDTWEDLDARADYYDVITEVAKLNCDPFVKGLYAKFSPLLEKVRSFLG